MRGNVALVYLELRLAKLNRRRWLVALPRIYLIYYNFDLIIQASSSLLGIIVFFLLMHN